MTAGRDADVLDFVANRLVEVYGESPDIDFIHALRRIEDRLRQEDSSNRFAKVMALHNPDNMPHGMPGDYYVGWHRAIEAALRTI